VARPLYQLVTILIVAGAGWLHASRLAPEPYPFVGSAAAGWFALFAAIHVVVGYAIGLPELALSRSGAAFRGLLATVASFSVISAFQTVLATPLLPRSASALIGVLLPIWTVVAWNLSRDAKAWAETRDRVVLVADRADDETSMIKDLADGPESPASLVGFLTLERVRAAGTDPVLVREVEAAAATILVLDAASQADPVVVEQAAALHRSGIRIRTLSLFYEQWIGKLPHAELARVSLLFDIGELHRARYVRAKRVVDLVSAVVGLIALGPLLIVVAGLNLRWNRGPLFYRQPRVGRHGDVFEIWKLRTMAPTGGPSTWTAVDDRRITPLGAFLRRTHLDELPQVLNILQGDLSLVGPRPEQPHYVEQLGEKIAFYDVRHIVRPGLTGWAQIKQGYASADADAFEKLQLDFFYLRRQGLALDARIMWRTLRGVVGGDGR